jgi:hypothetical protein
MAGSMCGAWLGYVEIPERRAAIMADYSYLNLVAEYLTLVVGVLGRLSESMATARAIGDHASKATRANNSIASSTRSTIC